MREIKFRGRVKNTNKPQWVYGIVIPPQYSSWDDWTLFDGERRWIVDPKTVGLYTGQKDVNGVDIYEGDILEDVNENTVSRNRLRMVVSFGQYHPVCNSGIELGFFMQHIPERDMWRRDFMFWVNDGVKVIGNAIGQEEETEVIMTGESAAETYKKLLEMAENAETSKTNFDRITENPFVLAKFIARYGMRVVEHFGMEKAEKSASWAVNSKVSAYPLWKHIEQWLNKEYKK